MSIVQVRGEIFHCMECSYVLTVEFEEGLSPLQIGDEGVFRQKALTKIEGYPSDYYHHQGVCDGCYRKRHSHPEAEANARRLIRLIEQYRRNVENIERESFRQPEAKNKCQMYKHRVDTLLRELGEEQAFMEIPVGATKVYNPLLAFAGTQRTPAENTPLVMFYVPMEIDRVPYDAPIKLP